MAKPHAYIFIVARNRAQLEYYHNISKGRHIAAGCAVVVPVLGVSYFTDTGVAR